MLTVADTVLLEQRRETADLRDLASLQHSYQEGHTHEATCGLCHEKDKQIQQLTAEMTMLKAAFATANRTLKGAERYFHKRAMVAWRKGDQTLLTRMASLFFWFRMRCSFSQAYRTAKPHVFLADMRAPNALFGETKDGETWK